MRTVSRGRRAGRGVVKRRVVRKTAPRSKRLRARAREMGVGVPDLVVPSAHGEIEMTPELREVGVRLYAAYKEAEKQGRVNEPTASDEEATEEDILVVEL